MIKYSPYNGLIFNDLTNFIFTKLLNLNEIRMSNDICQLVGRVIRRLFEDIEFSIKDAIFDRIYDFDYFVIENGDGRGIAIYEGPSTYTLNEIEKIYDEI